MAIIRSREELLPVTCAVLQDADRKAFFADVGSRGGGKPDQVARLLNIPASVVDDWISGKLNIPYHLLQRLAHEFGMELPPIRELRRETQPVVALATAAPSYPPPGPARKKASKEEPRQQKAAPAHPRQPRRARPERAADRVKTRETAAEAPREAAEKAPRARGAQGPGKDPKLSDKLAYWTGMFLGGVQRREGAFVFAADRNMGQNFADTWARRTKELFGVSVHIATIEDGKLREASFTPSDPDGLLKRLGLAHGKSEHMAIPRWVWSNPTWKTACLKGLMDARGRFRRAPALAMTGLSETLARSACKMFEALKFKPTVESDGTVLLEGVEQVDRYAKTVATDNMKLRDQLKAHFRHAAGSSAADETPESAASEEAASLEYAEQGVELDEEPADAETATEASETDTTPGAWEKAPPAEPAPAPKTHSRKQPRPRRTLYRGRPGSR